MKKSKAMMHPVRVKIVQSLMSGKELTTQQISQKHPDVATVSLYRHINVLLEAELIKVVHENKIRGTVEKTFALNGEVHSDINKEAKEMSREELEDLFFMFMTNLLGQFEDYLESDDVNLENDKVCIRHTSIYLTDKECVDLIKDISSSIVEVADNKASTERRARTIATIVIPEAIKNKNRKGE